VDFSNNNLKSDNQILKSYWGMKNKSEGNEKSNEKIRLYFYLKDL
jgi:hypothetical protein